jgi:hypothetical protein
LKPRATIWRFLYPAATAVVTVLVSPQMVGLGNPFSTLQLLNIFGSFSPSFLARRAQPTGKPDSGT